MSLRNDYFIDIDGRNRMLYKFRDSQALHEALLEDNSRYYYFTSGKDYKLGSADILKTRFVDTVKRDFARMFPLYEMIQNKNL